MALLESSSCIVLRRSLLHMPVAVSATSSSIRNIPAAGSPKARCTAVRACSNSLQSMKVLNQDLVVHVRHQCTLHVPHH